VLDGTVYEFFDAPERLPTNRAVYENRLLIAASGPATPHIAAVVILADVKAESATQSAQ
jgi:hypothetical protein